MLAQRFQRRRRHLRRAAVAVQVAVMSTMILGVGALAIDLSAMFTTQTELQVAADAAALAAASQLIAEEGDPADLALAAAQLFAQQHSAWGELLEVTSADIEFGTSNYDEGSQKFTFVPGGSNFDALRVTVRRSEGSNPGPMPLMFANIFGVSSISLEARAAAVLIPRDISVVIDLSGSMNYDSQIRNALCRADDGCANLRDVWCALDGPLPSKPYVPGCETDTEYAEPADYGPAIGAMDEWGDPLIPGSYNAATDPGLVYLPRGVDWTANPGVDDYLIEQGYTEWERWSILTNETQGFLTRSKTDANGFSNRVIWKQGLDGAPGQFTVYVTSDGDGGTPGLSHIVFSIPASAYATAAATAASSGGYAFEIVSPDPATGVSGLKFEGMSTGDGGGVETDWFTFQVPTGLNLSNMVVASKAGGSSQSVTQTLENADPWDYNRWVSRVGVVLGLAEWNSGITRPGGDDDSIAGSGEIEWAPQYSECWNWTWANYIEYPRSAGQYSGCYAAFKYRYGLKTFTDFLLAQKAESWATCGLWATPEEPVHATKDAVQAMVDEIESLENLDQMSLEIFGTTAKHEVDLTMEMQEVADTLYERQAGHYDRMTNMGGGLSKAIMELMSERARGSTRKVIVLMSDGVPNIDENGYSVGDGSDAARNYALAMAEYAADQNFRIYAVSVGYGVDRELMQEIATIGHGQEFYAAGDPETYSAQLQLIFRTLGGERPVALIE